MTQITVEYQEHVGSDLTVVNAARASFGKESEWRWSEDGQNVLHSKDARLIRYLACGYRSDDWDELMLKFDDPDIARGDLLKHFKNKAQHWAPFAHPHVRIRMTVPIALARQLAKHQQGGVWSEESRRYISDTPEIYLPKLWHDRPENIKQGSGKPIEDQAAANAIAQAAASAAITAYHALLNIGVAPEEARLTLPLNMMTTVVWTGSLLFWARVYNQRSDGDAQRMAQDFAALLGPIMGELYPVSWRELT